MTPREVPDRLTPCSALEVARALVIAWGDLFTATPTREAIGVLLAQGALETGWWRYCHCYNLGNAKSVPGDGRSWTFYRCNEVIAGRVVWFDPPHAATRFRAFDTLQDGARDYLSLLHRRFAPAWGYVLAGDADGFARELSRLRYYTAPVEDYARALRSIYGTALGRLPADFLAPEPWTDADQAALEEACPYQGEQSIAACLAPATGDADDRS